MKRTTIATFAKVALVAGLVAGPASADGTEVFSARLFGDSEVPPINSAGTATFHMEIGATITFTLTFSGLSSNLLVSHLHFAPTKVAGGVMIFLCGGGNQPTCPAATSGTISGTITAANVTGPATQGIAAGDLTSALEAVREGNAYANMHTDNFKGGEIRGQVRPAIVARGRGWKGNAMRRFRGRRPPRPAIAENRESDPSLERREAS